MTQYGENNYYSSNGASGGFMAGSPFGSGSGSPGGVPRRAHALRPCTCKQLLNATQEHTDAEWLIDDTEVSQITIVGHVVSVKQQTTNMIYVIDDGTGRLEARHWDGAAAEDTDSIWKNVTDMSVVRVIGTLKAYGPKRYLNATHIRPVHHPDEVEFHYLETVFVAQVFKRGLPPQVGQETQPTSNNIHTLSAYTAQPTGSNTAIKTEINKATTVEGKIIAFMRTQPKDNAGVHVGVIAKAIGGDGQAIDKALDKLMDDGLVFTTIDETHFSLSE